MQCGSARSMEFTPIRIDHSTAMVYIPKPKAWQTSTQHAYTFHDHTRTHWINKYLSGSHTCATCQEEMQSLRFWILSNLCSKTTFGAFQPPPCWNGKWMTPWSAEPRRVLRTNGWVLVGPWSRVTCLETEHTHTHMTRVPSINWIFTDQHLHATQAVTEAHQFMPINVYIPAIFHPHPATTLVASVLSMWLEPGHPKWAMEVGVVYVPYYVYNMYRWYVHSYDRAYL